MPRGLQEWIHLIEEGEWKSYVKLVVLILGLIGLAVFYDFREFRNFSTEEAMDAAQIARNFSEKRGFTTKYIRPLSLHLLQKTGRPLRLEGEQPDLANPPVYPVLLAGVMKMLPFNFEIVHPKQAEFARHQPEVLIAFVNQALFFVLLLLTFVSARRLFDSSVAWLSVVLLAGTNLLWKFSISGLPTILLLVIFAALVWVVISIEANAREPKHSVGWLIGAGAAAGGLVAVGTLTRYSFGFFLIPLFVFIGFFGGARRGLALAVALVTFCGLTAPWLFRNYQISHTLFGTAGYAILDGTAGFPGNTLERTFNDEFDLKLGATGIDDFIRKFLVNSAQIFQNGFSEMTGSWISAFFLVSLLLSFRNPALSRLRYFMLAALLTALLVQSAGRTHLAADSPVLNSENLLVLLAPAMFIFGAGLFYMLTDLINFPFPLIRLLLTAGFVFILSAPLILQCLPPRHSPIAYPPYYPPLIRDTADLMRPDELMMSDMPWAVAWYGNRKCLALTLDAPMDSRQVQSQNPNVVKFAPPTPGATTNDFFLIYDNIKPIQGLYLTPLTMDARFLSEMLKRREWGWGRFVLDGLLRTNVTPTFPLKFARAGYLPDQMFLTDRERWRKDRD